MPSTFSSSRILQPVRPWFILLSLFAALVLNFLPTSAWPWMPDWVALLIVFWSIREPRRVGMGTGFILGLAMDVADASLLGQHALAYVLASYASSSLSRRILWFPVASRHCTCSHCCSSCSSFSSPCAPCPVSTFPD